MHWIALQVRKRTVTRSKVINRNLDTHIRKRTHDFNRLVRFTHGRVFGNFELQVARIQVRFGQHTTHIVDHGIHRELLCREVHRHLDILIAHVHPLLGLLTSHTQDERTHRHNKARFFGNRDKFSRRNNASFRLVPAHKRFKAHNLVARLDIDNRLVHEHKFLCLNSPADFEFELVKLHRLFANATAKELDTAMVNALLHIAKACICIGENIFDAIDILVHDNRHRNADVEVLAFQRNRRLYFIMNIAYKRYQIIIRIAALDVMQDHSKNIRSNTSHAVIRAGNRL